MSNPNLTRLSNLSGRESEPSFLKRMEKGSECSVLKPNDSQYIAKNMPEELDESTSNILA